MEGTVRPSWSVQDKASLGHPMLRVTMPHSEHHPRPHPGVGPESLWQQVPGLLPTAVATPAASKASCEGVAGSPPRAAAAPAPAAPRDRHASPTLAPTQLTGSTRSSAQGVPHPAPCWGGDRVPEPPPCHAALGTCATHRPAPRQGSPCGHPGCSRHAVPCRAILHPSLCRVAGAAAPRSTESSCRGNKNSSGFGEAALATSPPASGHRQGARAFGRWHSNVGDTGPGMEGTRCQRDKALWGVGVDGAARGDGDGTLRDRELLG